MQLSYIRHFVLLQTQPLRLLLIAGNFLKQLYFLTKAFGNCGIESHGDVIEVIFEWHRVLKVKSRTVLVVVEPSGHVPTSIAHVGKFMFMIWEICHKGYEWRGWIWNSVNNFSRESIFAFCSPLVFFRMPKLFSIFYNAPLRIICGKCRYISFYAGAGLHSSPAFKNGRHGRPELIIKP